MKRNLKKGVSLITLIITIIVMIILATAVILTFTSTNTIGKANEAKFKQNVGNYQDELNLYLANRMLDNYYFDTRTVNFTGNNMRTAIPSMTNQDIEIFEIKNGKLVIKGTADDDYKNWAEDIGISVAGATPTSSAPGSSSSATVKPTGNIGGVSLSVIKNLISADTKPGFTGGSQTGLRVAQGIYGRKINYSANGITDWQVFFIGKNGTGSSAEYNIYLISKDMVPYTSVPSDLVRKADYQMAFGGTSLINSISATNKMITRGFVPASDLTTLGLSLSSGTYSGSTLKDKVKASLFMLDESKWSAFVNASYKGEVAYGGPTPRMLIDSSNEYFGTSVATAITADGYTFDGAENATLPSSFFETNVYNNIDSMDASALLIAQGYAMAGPGISTAVSPDPNGKFMLYMTSMAQADLRDIDSGSVGMRVVVGLSSDAKLTWVEPTGSETEGHYVIS